MHPLPDGYRIRPATLDDVDQVAELLRADDLAQMGDSAYDADFVRDLWTSKSLTLADDTWVVTNGSSIIAHGHVQAIDESHLKSWGVVHPEHRGRGVGSALLDRVEERASQRMAGIPEVLLHLSVGSTDAAAEALVHGRGYEHVRSYRHMQIDLQGAVDQAEPPPGIEIRGIDPDHDLPTVHSIFMDAFRDEWGYDVTTFDEWFTSEVDSPSYDPTLWFMAIAAEEPVGALSGLVWGDHGWVGELGVRKPWRGRGIASALLGRSFATFAGRGLPRVMLNVDAENPTGAVRLYERVGMRVAQGWEVYEKRFGRASSELRETVGDDRNVR